ncbi:hypothetical protein ACRCUN_11025 [Mycobacterium sp. LTG2003]
MRVGRSLLRIAAGAAVAGAAVIGAMASANAATGVTPMPLRPLAVQEDPACGWLGWRHPLCGGGAFETPPDDGIPGDNAAEGGIPAPAMVPNIDGSLSPPGTPGAI